MIVTISNAKLSATINTLGAELFSLVKNNKNYIWTVEETYWNKTSPILFPLVGKLKNDSYTHTNKTYTMSRHGFARNLEFTFDKKSEHQVIFELNETEETKAIFPFQFQLFVAYTLMDNELVIEYFVRNQSNEVLPFSIGAHPAFAIDKTIENYTITFNKSDIFESHILENGILNGAIQEIPSVNNSISLHYDLFEKWDTLVFKNLKSNEVILSKSNKNIVKINFDHFPYLGFWTKKDAPFLCIEPWCGLADSYQHNEKLEEKEGINLLPAGEDFLRAIRIEILE